LLKHNFERILLIGRIRSLDDGIDIANSASPLLAAYLFAQPGAAKYLSQFIHTNATFCNNIPAALLGELPWFVMTLDRKTNKFPK
jgi:hypothetical protein